MSENLMEGDSHTVSDPAEVIDSDVRAISTN